MPKHRIRCALVALALTSAGLFAGAGIAGAVLVTTGSGSGLAGQTVDIALNVTSTTGLAIRSCQFTLSYNSNIVTATDVLEAGNLVGTAGWGDATFNVTSSGSNGKINFSHAGSTALTGSGVLLRVRFVINSAQLTANSTALTLSNF